MMPKDQGESIPSVNADRRVRAFGRARRPVTFVR
jgi:hypothetical protein